MIQTVKSALRAFDRVVRTRYYVIERLGRYYPIVDRPLGSEGVWYDGSIDYCGLEFAFGFPTLHSKESVEEAKTALRSAVGTDDIEIEVRKWKS
jgi:hypothetical protein